MSNYSVIIMQSRSRKCVNLLKNALNNNKFYDEVLYYGRIMGSGTWTWMYRLWTGPCRGRRTGWLEGNVKPSSGEVAEMDRCVREGGGHLSLSKFPLLPALSRYSFEGFYVSDNVNFLSFWILNLKVHYM